MLDGFRHLSAEEFDLLVESSALVTVLVGASDGDLDRQERTWSEKMLRARTYTHPDQALNDFYRVVAEGHWARVHSILAHYPKEVEARTEAIVSKLEGLNAIFPKLDPNTSGYLYQGLLRLAEEVAEASGGFLRIGAVSAAEAEWIKLPMVTPVPIPQTPEEAPEKEDVE